MVWLSRCRIRRSARKKCGVREDFYDKIVWIVNGDRQGTDGRSQTLDRSYFNMGRSNHPIRLDPLAFPVEWLGKANSSTTGAEPLRLCTSTLGMGSCGGLILSSQARRSSSKIQPGPYQCRYSRRIVCDVRETPRNKQIKINLGVFTPIRINDFVECSKRGRPVQGGFGLGELGVFNKEFVLVDTVESRVAGDI